MAIPYFDSYQKVAEHFKSVKPILGRKEEVRPIGKRRYDQGTIVEKTISLDMSPENPLGTFAKAYVCKLYGHDAVTFYPNGNIEIEASNHGYPSLRDFISNCIRHFGQVVSYSGKWYFINTYTTSPAFPRQLYLFNGYRNPHPKYGTKTLLLKNPKDNSYYVADPVRERRHLINRKAIADIRRKYNSFIEYGAVALSLSAKVEELVAKIPAKENRNYENVDDVYPNESFVEHGIKEFRSMGYKRGGLCYPYLNSWTGNRIADISHDNQTSLFQALDKYNETGDINLLYSAFQYVATQNSRYLRIIQSKGCDAEMFKEGFEKIIKEHFSSTVFKEVEVPLGVGFICRNKKYFLYNEGRTIPQPQGFVHTVIEY